MLYAFLRRTHTVLAYLLFLAFIAHFGAILFHTLVGTRLRLLLPIGSGLRCRGEKRDPVLYLLTGSAFRVTKHDVISNCALDRCMFF